MRRNIGDIVVLEIMREREGWLILRGFGLLSSRMRPQTQFGDEGKNRKSFEIIYNL